MGMFSKEVEKIPVVRTAAVEADWQLERRLCTLERVCKALSVYGNEHESQRMRMAVEFTRELHDMPDPEGGLLGEMHAVSTAAADKATVEYNLSRLHEMRRVERELEELRGRESDEHGTVNETDSGVPDTADESGGG